MPGVLQPVKTSSRCVDDGDAPQARLPTLKNDISTLLGTILCIVFVLWSMLLGGDLTLFWDTPSVILVGGGTSAVILMHFTFRDMKELMRIVIRSYRLRLSEPAEEIERIIRYAQIARKEGIIALESVARELDDPFFAKGIQSVVDGYAPDMVRQIMNMEIDATRARHSHGKKILEMFASFAPAFGMIGTLVGLVQMLSSLSDPSQIGGGMAVALLTTLYGALIANMICLPLAGKLDIRAKQEANTRSMIVEGLLSIQSGEKPAIIREKLLTFIPPKDRKTGA